MLDEVVAAVDCVVGVARHHIELERPDMVLSIQRSVSVGREVCVALEGVVNIGLEARWSSEMRMED